MRVAFAPRDRLIVELSIEGERMRHRFLALRERFRAALPELRAELAWKQWTHEHRRDRDSQTAVAVARAEYRACNAAIDQLARLAEDARGELG